MVEPNQSARQPDEQAHFLPRTHSSVLPQADESPELLRWRADLLLDEMMLGAVDVSAADLGRVPESPTIQPVQTPERNGIDHSNGSSYAGTSHAYSPYVAPDKAAPENGIHGPSMPERSRLDAWGHEPPGVNGNGNGANSRTYPAPSPHMPEDDSTSTSWYAAQTQGIVREHVARGIQPDPHANLRPPSALQTPPNSPNGNGIEKGASRAVPSSSLPPTIDPQIANSPRVPISIPPPAVPTPSAPDLVSGRPALTPDNGYAGNGNGSNGQLYAVEQRYQAYIQRPQPQPEQVIADATTPAPERNRWQWQDFSAPQPPVEAGILDASGSPSPPASELEVSVGAMSVTVNGKKRSTLLPRMSEVSAEELNQEIAALHGELGTLAPIGYEAGERARHLLDKAYTILSSDPMRSAEVEYYMQQVRAIVTRIRQTQSWSNLYRDRLRLYLGAWSLLSFIMLTTRYLFQSSLESVVLVLASSAADGLLMQHFASLVGTMFAGSFGGAVGALITMGQHARRQQGFYDRKYGLRGLMLPIIGLIFGALFYLLFGVVFHLAGVDPSTDWMVATLPVAGALIFGLSQESIYGTRR